MLANNKENFQQKSIYLPPIFLFALVVFFWALFDGILGYSVPLLMEMHGFSIGLIGLIIGTSSISGAIFDFLICKIFKSADFRRAFLLMFMICLFYPIALLQANTIWIFLVAMSLWGIYFDLCGFGAFNFISHYANKENYAFGFGVLQIFVSLAGILAPLIAGIVIVAGIDWHLFAISWFFLLVGLILFFILMFVTRQDKKRKVASCHLRRRKIFTEFYLWRKIGNVMLPVLCVTFLLSFMNAFFWTLAPLYVANVDAGKFGGLFLTAYILPALFVGWFLPRVTKRFGKKRTAFMGVLIGSAILSSFMYIEGIAIQTMIVFLAACFTSLAMPAVNAACADYISEAPRVDEEIATVEDFSGNCGYVAGPISAGILAQTLGIPAAFSILGLIGVAVAIILLIVTPRSIDIKVSAKEL